MHLHLPGSLPTFEEIYRQGEEGAGGQGERARKQAASGLVYVMYVVTPRNQVGG